MLKILLLSLLILNISCSSSSKEEEKAPVKKKPDVIRKSLVSNISKFKYCYQKELDGSVYTKKGTVRLNFIINSKGISEDVRIITQDNLSEELKQCLANVVRVIRFPAPLNGGTVEVSQPFNFFPKSR
jgi:hypothetical protein